jgi:hypothetical protein
MSSIMMFTSSFLFFFLFFFVVCRSEWVIGFSAQKISPYEGERCCLGGYGACLCRDQTGVHDDIYARAFYLSLSSEEEIVFVSIDTIGMSNIFIDEAIENVSDIIQNPNRVIMSSTHSHSAPDLAGLWGGVSKEYRSFVLSQIRAAVENAKNSSVPAVLKATSSWYTRTKNSRGWHGTDYSVLTLWAEDMKFGNLIGMVVNFGAHPTLLKSSNTLVSRDWVNGLVVTLENVLGQNKVMYVNAAQGDVLPNRSGISGNTSFDIAFKYGALLAQNVLESKANVSIVPSEMYFSISPFTQCVTNNAFIAAADSFGVCLDYNFSDSHGQCPRTLLTLPPKLVDLQVAYLRLGRDVQIAILPGETLTRMTIDNIGLQFSSSTSSSTHFHFQLHSHS